MVQSKHLLILIGGHFANAPRPQKEAAVAVEAGFRVTVMGTWTDPRLAKEDLELAQSLGIEFRPLLDLTKNNFASLLARAKGRLAAIAYQHLNMTLPESFGLTARHMLKAAKRIKPDFIMVHSEAGLWAGRKLLDLGFKVGVDFEDWFSEDLPPEARKARPVYRLKRLEHHLLCHSHLSVTTTTALSNALTISSGCRRAPLTIPNTFPISIKPDAEENSSPSLAPVRFYWFSQTIGPGRGLEPLAEALREVEGDWELHLRGNLRQYSGWFEETFRHLPSDRITRHDTVPNDQLSLASSKFDVGLALEDFRVRNRDLTATNKIFEYLRSHLAVIATDTKGQREVMEKCPRAGLLIPCNEHTELVRALQHFVDDRTALNAAKDAAFDAAATTWAWSSFAPQLGKSLQAACADPS